MAEQLRAALEVMNPIDREVLALRHFEELANSEVAEEQGSAARAKVAGGCCLPLKTRTLLRGTAKPGLGVRAGPGQHLAHLRQQPLPGERLLKELDTVVKHAMVGDDVRRVA